MRHKIRMINEMRRHPGFMKRSGIYALSVNKEQIKVGLSASNMANRLDQYSTYYPKGYYLHCVLLLKKDVKDTGLRHTITEQMESRAFELLKHKRLKYGVRKEGEWVVCSPKTVKQVFIKISREFARWCDEPILKFDVVATAALIKNSNDNNINNNNNISGLAAIPKMVADITMNNINNKNNIPLLSTSDVGKFLLFRWFGLA